MGENIQMNRHHNTLVNYHIVLGAEAGSILLILLILTKCSNLPNVNDLGRSTVAFGIDFWYLILFIYIVSQMGWVIFTILIITMDTGKYRSNKEHPFPYSFLFPIHFSSFVGMSLSIWYVFTEWNKYSITQFCILLLTSITLCIWVFYDKKRKNISWKEIINFKEHR